MSEDPIHAVYRILNNEISLQTIFALSNFDLHFEARC
ncbi:MAG: hypothetical protein ACJAZC_001220 [Cryomorphaceae bacterium]|jgi:hypothetical protein